MDTLRLQNVRSLVDTGEIELRRITLLVGKNSSGKSTFLRAFPLLKQSVRTRSTAPILWYGEFVDFGSFEEVHTKGRDTETLAYEVGFHDVSARVSHPYEIRRAQRIFAKVRARIHLNQIEGRTRLKSYCVSLDGDVIYVDLDNRGTLSKIRINDEDRTKLLNNITTKISASEVIPQISFHATRGDKGGLLSTRGVDVIEAEIVKYLRLYLGYRISHVNLIRMIRRTRYTTYPEFLDNLRRSRADLVTWNRFVDGIAYESSIVAKTLHAYYFLMTFPEINFQIGRKVTSSASAIAYIGPSRATGERYYRFQELGVGQIDPQGRNLAMFLNSMPRGSLSQFSDWMREAMGYGVKLERSAGHVQILLQEADSSEFFNLADIGYGLSQILPILAQIWSSRSGRRLLASPVVAIEQPELHLHPAYQARLANLFAGIVQAQFGDEGSEKQRDEPEEGEPLKLVIETHSETMINRFGELIMSGRLSPDDIAIYRFDKDEINNLSRVQHSVFLSDGTLDSWPIGFFAPEPEQ